MLVKWEKLDDRLRNDDVKKYYDILARKRVSLFFKRIFDIIMSLLMIIILSPLLLFVSIWIKIDSKGPAFYRQVRVTKNNKEFRIFKFRTMVVDADKVGSLITTSGDRRITKVGDKIRKVRLDELPQLFNIFVGDMTFVGTRPEVRKYVDQYTDEMMATLLLPAGVTSLASIKFKDEDEIIREKMQGGMTLDEAYINYILPRKMAYNLERIKKFSLLSEIGTMCGTLREVVK